MTSPFMSILHGFAEARSRMAVEREVHHSPSGERPPKGEGWYIIEADPSGYTTWERRSVLRGAEIVAKIDEVR